MQQLPQTYFQTLKASFVRNDTTIWGNCYLIAIIFSNKVLIDSSHRFLIMLILNPPPKDQCPGVVGPPTGTDRFIRSYSTTVGSPCSPAVMQVCPPTGAFRMVKSSDESFFKLYLGQLLYYCHFFTASHKNSWHRYYASYGLLYNKF